MIENVYAKLKSISGTNDKIAYLSSITDENVKYFLQKCYDPTIIFGISNIKGLKTIGNHTTESKFDHFKYVLDRLYLWKDLSGNKARDAIINLLQDCTRETQEVFKLILKKDLKCGIGIKSLQKAFGSNFIVEYKVQLANKYDENKKYKNSFWYATPKWMELDVHLLII